MWDNINGASCTSNFNDIHKIEEKVTIALENILHSCVSQKFNF